MRMRFLTRSLVAGAWVYFTYLFGWLGVYLLTGDRWFPVSLVTSLVPLAFYLLLGVFLLAALTRRRSLWLGGGAVTVLWVALFGGLFNVPAASVRAATPTLRAMTYNVEFRNTDVQAVSATIHAANPDVVGLQEVNPEMAASLEAGLGDEYPYQHFLPGTSVTGMGFLSRYPFEEVTLTGEFSAFWVGGPQVYRVQTSSGPVMVLNAHFAHNKPRDLNAEQIAAWAAAQSDPVVVLGDVNATDLSDAYRTLKRSGLQDAWREVGWGYGPTFPTSSDFYLLNGVPVFVPAHLVRIDYVFYSPELRALSVERLAWDGVSDHRAVVAELGWLD